MSNSRAFASNQRPNKATPSRGAVLCHPCLRRFTSRFLRFGILRHPSTLFSRAPPNLFLPTGLARVFHVDDHPPSTAKTSHFTETCASPDAGKRVLHLPFLISSLLSPCAPSLVLLHVSPSVPDGNRARDLPAAMLTKYSRILPAIAGLSASMCIFT